MASNDKLEQLLEQMYAQETLHDKDIYTSEFIDEEWTKFEAEHFPSTNAGTVRDKRFFLKIAASFIGILLISGIAYAAVHFIRSQASAGRSEETLAITSPRPTTADAQLAEQDSTLMQPIVFEDAELVTILDDIATFYQVEPVFKKEDSKHIRLYFTWNKKQDLDTIIDTFNKFERIHITRYDKILIIE